MSQHQIHINSPKVGLVLVTVGYDTMLNEAFINFYNEEDGYMSPPGTQIDDLQKLAKAKLGLPLPQAVVDAVQGDLADLRLGATDVGRRVVRYELDGKVIRQAVAHDE